MVASNRSSVTIDQLRDLAKIVKQERLLKGWNQDDLAKASGLGKAYISNIENAYVNPGRKPVTPSVAAINSLAKGLGIRASILTAALNDETDEIERIPDDDRAVLAGLRNAPEEIQRAVRGLVQPYMPEGDDIPVRDVNH